MDYEEIIEAIRQAGGGMSRDTAERAAQAPLQTLAERLPRGEAQYILQELPAELKPFIYTETDAEALDIDEFLSRVADREGTESRHARAVFAALSRALSPEAVEHLARRRHPEHRMPAAGEEHRDQLRLRSRQQPNGHGPRAAEPGKRLRLMCCNRARPPARGRPTSLIRVIRGEARSGDQIREARHHHTGIRT
jgi:uncharacterized protein (DUF2267 family)